MTQTGTGSRKEMILIRPYGAGFGQFDSAFKAGKSTLFGSKFRLVFYTVFF
jgi:hypothetical protein